MIYIFKKDDERFLSKYLSKKEVQCRCQNVLCIYQLIDDSVVEAFGKMREEFGSPLQINSAFRCQAHNNSVGGFPNSFHTVGHAVDFALYSPNDAAFQKLTFIAGKYFDKIKVYPTFIHGQTRLYFNKPLV